MSILKELSELVSADVISQETAAKIQAYYENRSGRSSNRAIIVFGILGAILVGLGIILILAHNWDEFPRAVKTLLAFLPLLLAQLLCGFTLVKKPERLAWRESTTTFLFFTVGASISLIGQIYHLPGDLSSFLLTWMLLCLPLIYVMKSSVAALLYLMGITYYAVQTGYWAYPARESYLYWPLLLLVLPHYYQLYRKKPAGNFTIFHHWLIPLSVTIVLGTVAMGVDELMFLAYFSLFGVFSIIGNSSFFRQQSLRNNAYKVLGSLGTMAMLLILSFNWFWEDLSNKEFQFQEVITAPEFFASVVLSLLAGALLFQQQKNKKISELDPMALVFLLFIIAFTLGLWSPISVVLINLMVLVLGLWTIVEGAKQNHFGILNYGLLMISALVVCRFLDTDLSFVVRGLVFIGVGISFFAGNYWMLKKREPNDG